jgi:hypothetical protein
LIGIVDVHILPKRSYQIAHLEYKPRTLYVELGGTMHRDVRRRVEGSWQVGSANPYRPAPSAVHCLRPSARSQGQPASLPRQSVRERARDRERVRVASCLPCASRMLCC